MNEVHVILPNDIDDPTNPSGGNVYDRRMCRGLAALGWSVREHAVPGAWPWPTPAERANLAGILAATPDAAIVVLDGLVGSAAPDVLAPHAQRLRIVVLMHMPLGLLNARAPYSHLEGEALSSAVAVVTTSAWSRRRLLQMYPLPADRVHVAAPGVDPTSLAPGSEAGSELLCVAAVTPGKGHDLLVEALATIGNERWRCVCVGPLHRDPAFVDQLHRQIDEYGIADRISFVGPCTGPELDARYAAADLLVLASRSETYGMVVTEALARGTPVLATEVDGLPEALGRAPDGSRPGILVPPGDATAFAAALGRWLGEPGLRRELRRRARARRATLVGWPTTSSLIATALSEVATGDPVRSAVPALWQGGARG